MGLIDSKIGDGSDGYFTYTITSADATSFSVTATRSGSDVWTGTLHLEQDGQVTGSILKSGGGTILTPPEL
jgi:type IV pilus assembly protein PilE